VGATCLFRQCQKEVQHAFLFLLISCSRNLKRTLHRARFITHSPRGNFFVHSSLGRHSGQRLTFTRQLLFPRFVTPSQSGIGMTKQLQNRFSRRSTFIVFECCAGLAGNGPPHPTATRRVSWPRCYPSGYLAHNATKAVLFGGARFVGFIVLVICNSVFCVP